MAGARVCPNVAARPRPQATVRLVNFMPKARRSYLDHCAAVHNREMHSTNGNISFHTLASDDRYTRSKKAFSKVWEFQAHNVNPGAGATTVESLEWADETCPVLLLISGETGRHSVPQTMGTMHHCLGNPEAFMAVIGRKDGLNEMLGSGVGGGSGPEPKDPNTPFSRARDLLRSLGSAEHRTSTRLPDRGVHDEIRKVILGLLTWDPDEQALVNTLRWVGVRTDPRSGHGVLRMISIPRQVYNHLTTDNAKDTTPVDNQRCYREWKDIASIEGDVLRVRYVQKPCDWRVLGLKAALYDALREQSFSQPAGVEWAVAAKGPWLRDVILTHEITPWTFEAIAVTQSYLDASFGTNNRAIEVTGIDGKPYTWVVGTLFPGCDYTTVVWLEGVSDIAHALWTLVHLHYPLAYLAETFGMTQLGDEEGATTPCTFVRNASLVSIPSVVDLIVFVTDSTNSHVRVGGVDVKVVDLMEVSDEEFDGELDYRKVVKPQVIDANELVRRCIGMVLDYRRSLREVLETYVRGRFTGERDWQEIDSLVSVLTLRFPRPLEAVRIPATPTRDEGLFCTGAPVDVLRRAFPDIEPTPECRGWKFYGHNEAVTPFDQVLGSYDQAKSRCILHLGSWSNHAELAFFSGLFTYDTTDIEPRDVTSERFHSSNLDRQIKGVFARRAYEEFKKATATDDAILRPNLSRHYLCMWIELVYDSKTVMPLLRYAQEMLEGTTKWSWEINVHQVNNDVSHTGIRTPPFLWRGPHTGATPQVFDPASARYALDTCGNNWTKGFYVMTPEGSDAPAVDDVFMRANLLDYVGELSRSTWPEHQEDRSLSFRISSTSTSSLYQNAGWSSTLPPPRAPWAWGWGITARIRDITRSIYSTLVWTRIAHARLTAYDLVPQNWQMEECRCPVCQVY